MTRRKRRNHASAFKAKVALAATNAHSELAEQDVHPNQPGLEEAPAPRTCLA